MPLVNAYMVRWAGAYTWVEDAGSIASHGRREGYLTTAAGSVDEAVRVGEAILSVSAQPEVVTTASIEPQGGDEPYINFQVGDLVTIPDETGTPVAMRVRSVSVTTDPEGNPVYVPELGSMAEERAQRVQRWLKRMANGTIGGSVESASPAPPLPAPKGAKSKAQDPIVFSNPTMTIAMSGRYHTTGAGRVVEVHGSLEEAGTTDTVFDVYEFGVLVVPNVTILAGDFDVTVTVDIPFHSKVSYFNVALTAAGAGASGLTVELRKS